MIFTEVLLFTFIGIILGIFTGLIPGIHVNTIFITLPFLTPIIFNFNFSIYAVFALIVSMAVAHTIFDFIPSIFLGVPEDSTALSILPGHKLLLQGKGIEALFLTIIGGLFITILFILLLPFLIFLIPILFNSLKFYIPLILILIVSFTILTEKSKSGMFFSFLLFLFSGFLGLITLNSKLIPEGYVFFPLFTGLFGIPTLIISLGTKSEIPPQSGLIFNIKRKLVLSGVFKSLFSSLLVGILPGVGAAQATVLTQELTNLGKKKNKEKIESENLKEFLISIGGINTSITLISFLSLYSIQKARTGASVAISKLIENFQINELILLISISLISIGISSILALYIGNKILIFIQKIPYYKISLIILSFLFIFGLIFTGILGVIVMLISTSIGMIAPLSKIKRSHSMGVIILPVILFYLKIPFS